ncbi:MAG: helix-turn-helix domain-containing protein [Paludibacteraceae bacterium]|nr:helix-turn-helix domain-containing protein [Paludibacteraceae bacterium]
MTETSAFETLIQSVNMSGVSVTKEKHGFTVLDKDIVFPHLIFTLCTNGSARAKYDLQEMTQHKNELGIIMPGHIMHPIDCTDDYTFTSLAISADMLESLKLQIFSHDYEKFHYTPLFQLTEEQAQRMLAITDLVAVVAEHDDKDLTLRRQLLLAQLTVCYEFLSYYRREIDRQWTESRYASLFNRFRSLVAEHYKESREVQYYAGRLNLTPKHFTKVIRSVANDMSPARWIDEYVTTQAKRLIKTQPNRTIQQISYELGFNEPTLFHHYFRRVTGMTPAAFRQSLKDEKRKSCPD